MKYFKRISFIFCVFALLCIGGCSKQLTHTEQTPPPPQTTAQYTEEAAANIVFYSSEKEPKELLDYLGKPVVLKFINCNDETAIEELEFIADLYNAHTPGKEFFIILQNSSVVPELDFELPFPVYFDPDKSASDKYETTDISSTFFIDKDGFIATKSIHPISRNDFEFGLSLIK